MKHNSLKIVVVLNEAFPELRFDLFKLPVKLRPDRLRALASLGFQVQNGRLNQNQQVPVAAFQKADGQAALDQGDLKSLRFAVVLNEAVPDLHSTFIQTPARLRAERMRLLASLGLHISSGGAEIISGEKKAITVQDVKADREAENVQAEVTTSKQEISSEVNAVISKPLAVTQVEASSPAPAEKPAKVDQDIPIKAGKRIAWLAKSLGG